ncbi:exportin-5 [Lethenteron reissneri]|uniref:exportin-5 n=1 Tax=Lethenteron reissneri TaxID=7753 RepID=UPI002AB6FE41|nr:exportin-5 [Lethenteron reissneri]
MELNARGTLHDLLCFSPFFSAASAKLASDAPSRLYFAARMAQEISAVCEELIRALYVVMDSASTHQQRAEALKFCEDFKQNSPQCVQCGMMMADKDNAGIVRHLGLQLLEHCIKFRWNNMSQVEKCQVKENVMGLLSKGTKHLLEEEPYIKDAVSRLMVEMIKREWPQQWPEMLQELFATSKLGETQAELMLLVLLRLAEDVVAFQALPQQRRRDIMQALTHKNVMLLGFLLDILIEHSNKFQQLKDSPTEEAQKQATTHCRVACATLATLAGFVEWVNMTHLAFKDCALLRTLCSLLGEPRFQLEAAECLLLIVRRKGKMEERKPLLVLFSKPAMMSILQAAVSAHDAGLEERHYFFLKQLCQVLIALGVQLNAVLGVDRSVVQPATFHEYLLSILAFTKHPSQYLSFSTMSTWCAFFRHEIISQDALLLQILPQLLDIYTTKLLKVGFPSKNDSPSCEYSRLDFESDEEYNNFFSTFRAQQGEGIRWACRIAPEATFQVASKWLQFQLTAPIEPGTTNGLICDDEAGTCTTYSPSFIQWDALNTFMDCTMSHLLKALEKKGLLAQLVEEGIRLLNLVLSYEPGDPLVLSCALSCMSTLMPFLSHDSSAVPRVLDKLFSSVTFCQQEGIKAPGAFVPRSRSVKNVRRHACSCLVRICRDYPELLLPCFESFCEHLLRLHKMEGMTQLERVAFMECLVIISNKLCNYDRQRAFLEQMLTTLMALWMEPDMQQALWSTDGFLAYFGLDKSIVPDGMEDIAGLHRGQLVYCMNMMCMLVKRARWPESIEEAQAGGFVVGETPSGGPVYRNACSQFVCKMLENMLTLSRTFHSFWLPEQRAKLNKDYELAFECMESEKHNLLAIPLPLTEHHKKIRTPLERMQSFITTMHESCYIILGKVGSALGRDFYNIPNVAQLLLDSALSHLDISTEHRLRALLKFFLKLFIQTCPAESYNSVLIPICGPVFSVMLQKLSILWQNLVQRSMESSEEDRADDAQEVLEDQLTRLVTREYLEILCACVSVKKSAELPTTMENMDEDEVMAIEAAPSESDEISELGKGLIMNEEACQAILLSAFTALSWNDTPTCHKAATHLCWPVLKQAAQHSLSPEAMVWCFTAVLRGLEVHGQHDCSQSILVNLAFQIYENMRPRFTELNAIMNQIPNISADTLSMYEQKLIGDLMAPEGPPGPVGPNAVKQAERRRKDTFKKLIAGVIAKDIGQKFRNEIQIRDLPRLFQRQKRTVSIEDQEKSDIGIMALFVPQAQSI